MSSNLISSAFPQETNDSSRMKEVMVDTRINKVLALRTDSVVMLEALNSIGEFYETNTVEARRSLRYNLETYNVENGKKFLLELNKIKQNLETTEQLSNELHEMCSILQLKVEKADHNMKNFIEKTSNLEKKKQTFQQNKESIEFFLLKFHMNEQDIYFLSSANLNHSNEFFIFFQKLIKLKESFLECQRLAEQQSSSSSSPSTSATSPRLLSDGSTNPTNSDSTHRGGNVLSNGIIQFELLEVLGNQKENAYHYLFQWIKEKCELFSDQLHHSSATNNANQVMNLIALEENTDLMHKLQIAIAHIKDIPIYFQQCQDLLIPAKRNILMNRFMIALTQGENNNQSQNQNHSAGNSNSSSSERVKTALDLQSHDPMLYVSSMLAWMHQSVAAEREYIEAIYNDQYHQAHSGHPQPRLSSSNNASSNLSSSVKLNEYNQLEILSRIVQTVAKPLRIRILQTLENNNSVDILYGLADLLLFYENIFEKVLPTENAIHSCIKGSFIECSNLFKLAMKRQIEYLTNTANHSLLLPNPLLLTSNTGSSGGGNSQLNSIGSTSSSFLELKVSATTREYSKLITNILKICCSSLSNLPFVRQFPDMMSSTPSAARETTENLTSINLFHMDTVLGDLIQPLLQYCRIQVSKLPSAEMAIFILNNIGFLQNEVYDYSNKLKKTILKTGTENNGILWETLLVEECKIWKNILIHEEISMILKKSEMDRLLEKIDLLPPAALLAVTSSSSSESLLGYTAMELENVVKSFYSILFTISLSSELEKLMNPILREEIRLEISKSISDSYGKVYRFINDERNGLDTSILLHSIDQVNVLLGNNPDQINSHVLFMENLTLMNSLQTK